MIASISGKITHKADDYLVVEVGGIGYQIFVPRPYPEQVHRGESISLQTHLVVREDSLTLYGFSNQEEVEFFTLLLGVNGVGPRSALEILSTHPPDTIRRAVIHEQGEIFQQVSGIGKKTAQKILLHLEGRVTTQDGLDRFVPASDTNTEVQEALVALGYSILEAQAALQSIPNDAPDDVETRLTIALRYFS
ncbi:MAG: Holliday junction branch migration protein RuvA [Anaerolineaceae bacterium 4572_5.1]|nr:MAG: Holliday junction branch migration protein RuvA [Anaerolineaceae bacterium 4572_5.1]